MKEEGGDTVGKKDPKLKGIATREVFRLKQLPGRRRERIIKGEKKGGIRSI